MIAMTRRNNQMNRLADSNRLCINFTPTGLIPAKAMTHYVPITIDEIVHDVHEAVEIGITMVHLHARNQKTGRPAWEPELYADMITKIRKFSPDLIICVSTSGRIFNTLEKRSACLFLEGPAKPDMASLTLSSLNFNKVASVNTPNMILQLASEMAKRGIKAELEAFDSGMINYSNYLIEKSVLKPPHYFNLILGNIACAQADLLHAGIMVRDLPAGSLWSFAGIGERQLQMNSIAIATGGGVRVGLEDNIWFDAKRTKLATNGDLLRRIHRIAEANERTVLKPSKMRELLGLKPGYGSYGARDEKK